MVGSFLLFIFASNQLSLNILLLGSGGREHVFAWKLRQSKDCEALYIAPGNAGTASCGTNVPLALNDFAAIRDFILEKQIDMLVVGPEEPLVKGIVDFLSADKRLHFLKMIGPAAKAAQLEGSKAFAKDFMHKKGIPTASYAQFDIHHYEEGVAYIKNHSLPVVLKADGLAAGKGVLICQNHIEALAEFEFMLKNEKFGEAGKKVVVESFLQGIEISVFVLTDGKDFLLLPEAKDYKRIGEGDTGLNTGGMGSVSPIPFYDETLQQKVLQRIILPTIDGLNSESLPYCGFIFFGLMICNGEPFVIEYNCRMGDPEAQVVIPRLRNDLVELFSLMATGRLKETTIQTDERAAAAVVAVSGGYPGNYDSGKVILGLEDPVSEATTIFQAGTALDEGTGCFFFWKRPRRSGWFVIRGHVWPLF